ncbi:MAG: hypothetical protein AAF152_11035 [Cyanobacteria bacterium P01_A01_bin.114]
MYKRLSLLAATAVMVAGATVTQQPAAAVDCVYRCASDEIQFLPGQSLNVEVVNNTQGRVNLERVLDFNPYLLLPGREVNVSVEVGQGPDLSMVFWDENYLPVKVMLHRPEANTLQIELLPSGSFSDRAVHLVNDGRVLIY